MSPSTLTETPPPRPSAPPPGSRTAEQIRTEIASRREELGRDVGTLRGRISELTDLGLQARRHKRELLLGAGILVGLGIGAFLLRRQNRV